MVSKELLKLIEELEKKSKEEKVNIYISLTHGLNSFGIEMNIINEENIINIISIN